MAGSGSAGGCSAAGADRSLETLDRGDLEAFVRQQMSNGLSPRSVAAASRPCAGSTGSRPRSSPRKHNPADDSSLACAGARRSRLSRSGSRSSRSLTSRPLAWRRSCVDRAAFAATGLRVSELVGVRLQGSPSRRCLSHLCGKSEQGTPGADRGAGAAPGIRRALARVAPAADRRRAEARDGLRSTSARGGPLTRVGFGRS